jgi:phytoene synthase
MLGRSDQLKLQAHGGLDAAERYCAELARREAKNFYWGFVALPRPQRMAIYALYSFARQVDDEADRPVAERDPARLAWHRDRLRRCLAGDYTDPVMQVLGPALVRYQIPATELAQVIDGVEMDLHRTRYQTWDELSAYCRLVASAVGRMCVRIFGFRDPQALEFADDLGRAMQLTNILRDIREDYIQFGRIYLPLAELARFGLGEAWLVAALHGTDGYHDGRSTDAWAAFVRFQAARAHELFASGLRVAALIPPASAACVLTMAGIYQGILQQIERAPHLPLQRRVSLSPAAKLGVAVQAWLRTR